MEYKSRSYRIDDEVAEAIRKLPVSLNQFLRKVLSADGAFEWESTVGGKSAMNVNQRGVILGEGPGGNTTHWRANRKPLLKPGER